MAEDLRNVQNIVDQEDTILSVAVTDMKLVVHAFRWNIKQFSQRINNKNPSFALKSPAFISKDNGKTLHWQLKVQWDKMEKRTESDDVDQYLSFYLCLLNPQSATITYQLEVLDSEKSWKKFTSVEDRQFGGQVVYGWDKFVKIADLLDPVNKVLEYDTLKLKCRILTKEDEVSLVTGEKFEDEQRGIKRKHYMVSDYEKLYKSPMFPDVTIKTKGSNLKTHKAVLSCRSPVFLAMFQSNMSETINNIVEILDFDDEVVKRMLKYIYSGEISSAFLEKKCMEMLQIADKYDIKGLKEEAEAIIVKQLSVKNVAESLILADMNNSQNLKARAMKFMNMNAKEVENTKGFQMLLKYNPSIFRELYLASLH